MTAPDRDTAEVLAQYFLSATPACFPFVLAGPGYTGRTSLQEATSHGLVDVTPAAITNWFWATWRFDTDRVSGEVRFGDREYAVSVVAAAAGAPLEFELWEWSRLEASAPTLNSGDGQFCENLARLQAEIERYSRVLDALFNRIALGQANDLRVLAAARAERQDSWRARVHGDQHGRARAQADDAFHAGDYSRVIQLLAPFESALTSSERVKVAIARRKALLGPG